MPFRGERAPTLKQDELDSKVEVQSDFHVRDFNLAEPADLKAYTDVMERVINSNGEWYQVLFINRRYEEQLRTWVVHVEWVQRYGSLSPRAADAAATQGFEAAPVRLAGTLDVRPDGEETLVQWPPTS